MVNNELKLDGVFTALADPTRRAILGRLLRGPASVSDLPRRRGISNPAVSKHLRILKRAGLLSQQRDGRLLLCKLHPTPLHRASSWMAQYNRFWTSKLDALEDYLKNTKDKETNP